MGLVLHMTTCLPNLIVTNDDKSFANHDPHHPIQLACPIWLQQYNISLWFKGSSFHNWWVTLEFTTVNSYAFLFLPCTYSAERTENVAL